MSIPATCRTIAVRIGCTLLPLALVAIVGCTYSGGQLLYMLGFGDAGRVDAEFTLTEGPLLVFIDDFNEQLTTPLAARYLFDELSQELLRQKAAKKIIPLATIDGIRQSRADFGKLSAREIGELAGAEQVLWVEVVDFLAEEQVFSASEAAYFRVVVRVLDPTENKRRSRVRLWPVSPAGQQVGTSLTGGRVTELKTPMEISRALAADLAVKIAKLFYQHQLGDFERPE